MDKTQQAPVLFLAGPTASGKSAAALKLALNTEAEIISADSRQIFREMTIGTAAPSPEDRRQVPHHFVEELPPGEAFTAFDFQVKARERIRDILTRGKKVIVAGGSGLYLSALKNGISDIPADEKIRTGLLQKLASEGPSQLYLELCEKDPVSASRMDKTKTHRVIRALEVVLISGKPISWWQESLQPDPFPWQARCACLLPERARLYERINLRVLKMVANGLESEVRHLVSLGGNAAGMAEKTVGYEEFLPYLAGKQPIEEVIELIQRNTRHYAKRQITWFRKDPDYHFFNPDDENHTDHLLGFWLHEPA